MDKISLVNFIDLTLAEKLEVLEWRNSPVIREWMYSQDLIDQKQHLKFIESLRNDTEKLYFMVKSDHKGIGVIDFTKIVLGESLHMGIYANPNVRGCGKALMNEIIKYSFNILKVRKIYAEVYAKNSRAFDLYKKFGFNQFSETEVSGKKVICMELNYENR